MQLAIPSGRLLRHPLLPLKRSGTGLDCLQRDSFLCNLIRNLKCDHARCRSQLIQAELASQAFAKLLMLLPSLPSLFKLIQSVHSIDGWVAIWASVTGLLLLTSIYTYLHMCEVRCRNTLFSIGKEAVLNTSTV